MFFTRLGNSIVLCVWSTAAFGEKSCLGQTRPVVVRLRMLVCRYRCVLCLSTRVCICDIYVYTCACVSLCVRFAHNEIEQSALLDLNALRLQLLPRSPLLPLPRQPPCLEVGVRFVRREKKGCFGTGRQLCRGRFPPQSPLSPCSGGQGWGADPRKTAARFPPPPILPVPLTVALTNAEDIGEGCVFCFFPLPTPV